MWEAADKRQRRIQRNRYLAVFALGAASGAFLAVVILTVVSNS